MEFNGRRYYLLQLHMHTPSEHQIELHLVFRSADALLVVGVLFEHTLNSSYSTRPDIVNALPSLLAIVVALLKIKLRPGVSGGLY